MVLEFFTDAACTDPVARWAETDGKFTVTYSSTDTGESGMTIEMTADGLKEMNTSKAVYSDASMVNSGYSDCTLRITYAATVNSSADVVYGDNGNPNKVVLTWKRTSQNSYYGMNALSHNVIMADRKKLKSANGLYLGSTGSGKSFAAKREFANRAVFPRP